MHKGILLSLWSAFLDACLETPRGMMAPVVAFCMVAIRNPVLEANKKKESCKSYRQQVVQ